MKESIFLRVHPEEGSDGLDEPVIQVWRQKEERTIFIASIMWKY
jgi:hypothetical protein